MNEQAHPVLTCSIDKRGAFKLDGDGGGSLTISFDSSQANVVAVLYQHYRECTLNAAFIKLPN